MENEKPIPEVPKTKQDVLLGLTIASFIISILGAFVAWAFVFNVSDLFEFSDEMQDIGSRARAVTPFLAAGAATVTFFSVFWRGAINSQQAFEDKRQNDSKEEADLGLLLEKGHVYTAKGKANDIALGIAMLDTVARAENGKYAPYALYEITRQLKPCFLMEYSDQERIFELIKGVFERLASDDKKRHRRPQTTVELDFNTGDKTTNTVVRIFPNMPPCLIRGGTFPVGPAETKLLEDVSCGARFAHTSIVPKSIAGSGGLGGLGGTVNFIKTVTRHRFVNCVISNFNIGKIGAGPNTSGSLPEVMFRYCNLTSTEFTARPVFRMCSFEECYYVESAPPFYNYSGEPEAIQSEILKRNGIKPWEVAAGLLDE